MVTAAHCVQSKRISSLLALIGDHDVRVREEGEQRLEILAKHVHPYYVKHKSDHDIAIFEFANHVEFSSYAQPIALSSPERESKEDEPVTVAGWGTQREGGKTAKILRFVQIRIVGQSRCKKAYPWVGANQVCAGLIETGGKDSCQGDSGGPLWITERGTA